MRTFETLRGRVIAGVLVFALLLCHGVFGSMHLSHDPLATPPETESGTHATASHSGHASHHGVHEALVEHDGGSASHDGSGMAPEYFAAFLALVFGSVFLLLRSKMSVFARSAPFRSKVFPRPAVFRPPARGPTLPYLQVFRL